MAAATAAGLATRAVAEDSALDALMGDAQRGGFGQGFDDASRTIHMPKQSEPTVSAATAQTKSALGCIFLRGSPGGGLNDTAETPRQR